MNLRVEVPIQLVEAVDEVAQANSISRTQAVVSLLNEAMIDYIDRLAVEGSVALEKPVGAESGAS
tara:strand:- start:945 stop:1139 length:195 start_codon:yes stop_codon:yes gene_type:complete